MSYITGATFGKDWNVQSNCWLLPMRTYVFMHQIAVQKENSRLRKFVSQFWTFVGFTCTWFAFSRYFSYFCGGDLKHQIKLSAWATLTSCNIDCNHQKPCNRRRKRNPSISTTSYLTDNCMIKLRYIKTNCFHVVNVDQ